MTEPIPDADGVLHVDTAPDANALPEPDDEGLDPRAKAALQKVRSEAQSLRARLRDAEADGVKLATQVADYQRREIERLASEQLVDPSDVWRVDPELQQSFYDQEFGGVVGDKVAEATAALVANKPHLARHTAPPQKQPIEGLRAGATPEQKKPPPPSWASALRGTGI